MVEGLGELDKAGWSLSFVGKGWEEAEKDEEQRASQMHRLHAALSEECFLSLPLGL